MNVLRRAISLQSKLRNVLFRPYSSDLYEPDYLEAMKPKMPLYDALNIQIRGYDFAVIESYQKLVHRLARNLDIDIEDAWAVPPQHLQVVRYKPNSEIPESQYLLKDYHRTVQITDVSAYELQVLLRAIDASIPEAITVQVVPHEDYHEEIRYVPDYELHALKQQLDDISNKRNK